MTFRLRLLIAAAATAFLVAHLVRLPRTLDDIDSINFALGVESFNVMDHRPHPPGYPVYIAMAKAATRSVAAVRPDWDRDRWAASGLALWGVIAGAAGVWIITRFWLVAGVSPVVSTCAALVAVSSPLFWLTASRPLTDAVGVVAAILVMGGLVRGLQRTTAGNATLSPAWMLSALGAGLVVGLRSQSMWMTGPLLLWGAVALLGRGRRRDATTLLGLAVIGGLVWFVPMIRLTGWRNYLSVLGSQSADDFAGPFMLAVSFTGRRLQESLSQTFVAPWQLRTFAHIVLGFGLIGIARLAWRQQRVLGVVCLAFVPYLLFHLAFQETVTIRYALPLVIPVSGLAVVGLASLGERFAMAATAAVVVTSLVLGEPRLAAYSHEGAAVFRAFQSMQRASVSMPESPIIKMHHQVWWGVRRVADWYRPLWDIGAQPFPGDREWLSVVEHFRSGATRPVWFLGHLPRTDIAAFDYRTTTSLGRYEFSPVFRGLIGGARVDSLEWWSIPRPQWMLGAGWALTPELAGMTAEDRQRGRSGPAEAFLLRKSGPLRLVIGGRYLGADNGPAGRVMVSLDGKSVAEWRVSAHPRSFVQWLDLPSGASDGNGAYARLAVVVEPESGSGAVPPVGLEQFDEAGADGFVSALTDGWHEPEEDPRTGMSWRWTTAASTIEVRGAGDRTLALSGESPLKYFGTPSKITVRAGDHVLHQFTPDGDFSEMIRVPADALQAASGRLTIETNQTFRPSDRGSPDRRSLGLRLFSVAVR